MRAADASQVMQMLAMARGVEVTDQAIFLDEAAQPSLGEAGEADDVSSPTSRRSSDANSAGLSPRHVHRGSMSSSIARRRSTNASFSSWGNFSVGGGGGSMMSDVGETLAREAKMASLPSLVQRKDVCRFPPSFVAEQLLRTMCRSSYFAISRGMLRTASARKHSAAVQRLVRFFEVLS
jgi:hypothetical protein